MANIKSQKKRIVTAEKARMRNKAVRSELKTVRVPRQAAGQGCLQGHHPQEPGCSAQEWRPEAREQDQVASRNSESKSPRRRAGRRGLFLI